jgi:hypothetical protein
LVLKTTAYPIGTGLVGSEMFLRARDKTASGGDADPQRRDQ